MGLSGISLSRLVALPIAVGLDQQVAEVSGIPVNRTRIIAIILSTVLACIGHAIFLQNFGTLNTYNSHDQTGLFSTAARATFPNVFLGVTIFHLVIIVTPQAVMLSWFPVVGSVPMPKVLSPTGPLVCPWYSMPGADREVTMTSDLISSKWVVKYER